MKITINPRTRSIAYGWTSDRIKTPEGDTFATVDEPTHRNLTPRQLLDEVARTSAKNGTTFYTERIWVGTATAASVQQAINAARKVVRYGDLFADVEVL